MTELRKSIHMAEAIKNVLRERHMSKSEFASMMGRDVAVVKEWLSGTYRFNLPTLLEISVKLELI
ncbi:MAG TPA: helix-turn-helix domain-containing protein [Pedobacter sp.]|uniref:helix-turn-helix domain-containing protein n=1 Tax=Pedobacter sp. TaxID=1411316 RepID=UPI002C4D6493|nr:helix-turn-helix domain-containing protein [Pedobacter sp.]HMI03507.1 helix-turn-helix domain-containing protein [Pedobacter sp.]